MSQTLHYIVYASSITLPSAIHRSTFLEIEKQANKNNILTDITGFLCFKDGKFLQYFEGTEIVCINLLNILKNDPRHRNLTLIAQGTIPFKCFKDWSMCCFSLDEQTYDLNDNFLDFDVSNWKESEVLVAISDMIKYRSAHQLAIPETSYFNLLITKVVHQHKIFLIVEAVLLFIVLATSLYFFVI